jgi:heme/copper-type cytochrome/quinol oxidase subunit 2
MNSACDQSAASFGERQRLHDLSWAFAPEAAPEQEKPNWFLLAFCALAHFVVIFGVITVLWLVTMTGGVSAADIRAIAHELTHAAQP